MTRKEALERLDLCQNVCNDCLTCASHDEALDMAIAALREQDSNANQHVSNTSNALGGWISVKERLPGDEKPVLVYYGFWRKENAGTALRYTGTLSYFRFDPQPHWQHESTGLIVTHWMPLPEPPKEEV